MSTVRKAAEEIIGNMKRAYTAPYTIVPADEQAFSHLDLSAYRRFKETLERDGYGFLSDYEILEVNNSPNSLLTRTMIRCMVSADGRTSAGYYQIQPRIGQLVKNLLVGIVNLRFMAAPSFFLQNVRTKHYSTSSPRSQEPTSRRATPRARRRCPCLARWTRSSSVTRHRSP